jgi:hypothetical protein
MGVASLVRNSGKMYITLPIQRLKFYCKLSQTVYRLRKVIISKLLKVTKFQKQNFLFSFEQKKNNEIIF